MALVHAFPCPAHTEPFTRSMSSASSLDGDPLSAEEAEEEEKVADEVEEAATPTAVGAQPELDAAPCPNIALAVAKALVPHASTSGFIQYGEALKRSKIDSVKLTEQAHMLADVILALQGRRLTSGTAQKAIEKVYQAKSFFVDDEQTAYVVLAKRLSTMLAHYHRAKTNDQRPDWLLSVESHLPAAVLGATGKKNEPSKRKPAAATKGQGAKKSATVLIEADASDAGEHTAVPRKRPSALCTASRVKRRIRKKATIKFRSVFQNTPLT